MALMPIPDRWSSLPGMSSLGPKLWRGPSEGSSSTSPLDQLLDDFTRRWELGEEPRAEDYLGFLPDGDADGPVELVYHEYCLAESSGRAPDTSTYLPRFPQLAGRLRKVLEAHRNVPGLLGWDPGPELPVAGDEIGPFLLVRELGRGSFARVFLARQTDLGDRPLVVKVSARPTAEARLMARADHPNIVSILRDAETEEGLHLVCMPFLGGATLGAVLDRIGPKGRRPGWGGTILEALDAVSAPEYPSSLASGTTREQIDGMSYSRAVSWMIARLAGALDHAFSKGVTHGDLKPSNVLLAADGRPMLLDFNLSTDWLDESADLSVDPGGTLAYMAPERLSALAGRLAGPAAVLQPIDRHRADIYSLGLILLEALTGKRPEVPPLAAPGESPEDLAGRLAHLRGDLPSSPDRAPRGAIGPLSRTSWPATVPAGLRPVLSKCLDPVPSRRYKNSRQLMEDLDLWREELPLRHARPSRWAELGRHLHRRRRAIAAIVVVWVVFAAVGGLVWRAKTGERRVRSLQAVAEYWDHIDTGIYRFKAPGQTGSATGEGQDRVDTAWALLEQFRVASDAAWRRRAEFALLPERERHDLEALLLEQGVRFALVVSRPEFDGVKTEREAAACVLLNLGPAASTPDLAPLRTALGLPASTLPAAEEADWRPAYLNAILADAVTAEDIKRLGLNKEGLTTRKALQVFTRLTVDYPESFWFQYRAAASAWRLEDHELAEQSTRRAVALRPNSAAAHLALATCLHKLKRHSEAWEACEKARALDPRAVTATRTAFFLARDEAVKKSELARYQALLRPRRDSTLARLGWELRRMIDKGHIMATMVMLSGGGLDQGTDAVSDVDLRYWRALDFLRQKEWADAKVELDRILELEPSHLAARFDHGVALQQLGRTGEALEDYEWVLADPHFEELVAMNPEAVVAYPITSAGHLRRGEVPEGIALSIRGLARANEAGRSRGEAHYSLARAYGVAALSDVTMLRESACELLWAGSYSEKFMTQVLARDPLLSPVLAGLQADIADLLAHRE